MQRARTMRLMEALVDNRRATRRVDRVTNRRDIQVRFRWRFSQLHQEILAETQVKHSKAIL